MAGIKSGLNKIEPFGRLGKTFGKQALEPDKESQGDTEGIVCGLETNLWCCNEVESGELLAFLFSVSRCLLSDDPHGTGAWCGNEVESESEVVHGKEPDLWLGNVHESTPS